MSPDIAYLDPARARLAQITARLSGAAQELATAIHGDLREALDAAEQMRRLSDALTGHLLNEIDQDGRWALDGQRSFTTWAQARTGDSAIAVSRRITRARALRQHLPLTSQALDHGEISATHADHIIAATTTSPQRLIARDHPVVGEHFLVRTARTLPADRLRTATRAWAAQADPGAEDRAYRQACTNNEVTLGRTTGGWHLRGWLDEERGLTLATALEAATGTISQGDKRTRAQRNAEALHTLIREKLDAGTLTKSAKVRPHLLIHIPYTTLRTLTQDATTALTRHAPVAAAHHTEAAAQHDQGDQPQAIIASHPPDYQALTGLPPATFSDGTPLAPSQLMAYLCDSTLHRAIFGPDSEPLDIGRAQRLHTTAQRAAIIARDKHCQYPACTLPPLYCEPHHAHHWAHGGKTNVHDAILLCWTHHRTVHTHHLSIHRYPNRWEYRQPDGTLHATAPRNPHTPHW